MKHLLSNFILVSALMLPGCASKEVIKSQSVELKPIHGGSDKGLLFQTHPECRSKYIDKRPKELHCD